MRAQNTLVTIALTLAAASAPAAQAPAPARTADSSRAVTLSLAEYNRLIDLASRPADGAAAPVGAVLSGADIRVRVDRDTVRGTFALTGDVLQNGYARVGLLAGATLVDASAGGRPVPLVADGAAHAALVPGPAPFSLTLDWGAALTFGPGRAAYTLPVPPAGAARATIDLPGEQADVRVSPGLVTSRAAAGGRTIIEVTLDPGRAAEVSWSMRDSAPVAAAREVRTLADVRTLVSLGESDVRMVALVDLTVITGELRTVALRLPPGYELTGITGSTVDASEVRDGLVSLTLRDPAARFHQFLISLERSHQGGSFSLETGLVALGGVQRERGEVAVEGGGTLELTTPDREGLHRIDVRELHASLQSLARQPILSAFRYQRTTTDPPSLALDVARFDDAVVLAAVADRASATTLVTGEGRALTEITLRVQNRAQPFMKVTLPPGATMVSVEVGGQTAKPVLGADGIRIPLMRAGFRPQGAYDVSFVYLHAGTPFAKKGDLDMVLPRMDLPIGYLAWELFVPDRYAARAVGGNMIEQALDLALVSPVAMAETVTVTGHSPVVDQAGQKDKPAAPPSENIVNLQKRTAGVLPIRVDVPKAGTSHQFAKPLVVNQEASVRLRYRRR